ncbi:DUF2808 domain-containing protein [Stanieria cyanosphaera]|nr:DUF2808 domain-containing protein [Stanieria cyanosphaera]
MIDNLMKTAVLTAMLMATTPTVGFAANNEKISNVTYIEHSGAHPSAEKFGLHHFELNVQGRNLKELSVAFPKRVRKIREIEVTDREGRKIESTTSISDREAKIVFAQPVSTGTILSVKLKGVKPRSRFGHVWLYRLSGQMVGLNPENIPLGTVRIQTHALD